jgi:hypothetical protein
VTALLLQIHEHGLSAEQVAELRAWLKEEGEELPEKPELRRIWFKTMVSSRRLFCDEGRHFLWKP